MGWTLFPSIHTASDIFCNLHLEVLDLLGYKIDKHARVVEKIKVFIGRIAHRALADMLRMRRTSKIANMWLSAVSQTYKKIDVKRYVIHM